MKTTNRKLALATSALIALSTAASATTLRLNHNNPEDHPVHISMQKMADRFEELTKGDLKIRIYANAQLAGKILGWRAQHSIFDICADAWRWQMRNPNRDSDCRTVFPAAPIERTNLNLGSFLVSK